MDEAIDGLDEPLCAKAATRANVLMDAGVIPAEAHAVKELVDGLRAAQREGR